MNEKWGEKREDLGEDWEDGWVCKLQILRLGCLGWKGRSPHADKES